MSGKVVNEEKIEEDTKENCKTSTSLTPLLSPLYHTLLSFWDSRVGMKYLESQSMHFLELENRLVERVFRNTGRRVPISTRDSYKEAGIELYPGAAMLRGKARAILELLEQGPKTATEIYLALGATTESQKRNLRKVLEKLREKGLIQRHPPQFYSLTSKGREALRCVRLLEE